MFFDGTLRTFRPRHCELGSFAVRRAEAILEGNSMWKSLLSCSLSFLLPVAANAAELAFSYNGSVNSAFQLSGASDLLGGSAPIKIGAPVTAKFTLDPGAVSLGACLSLGGGMACSYNATLKDYSLSVGSYSRYFVLVPVTFYLHNDTFGQDALGVAYTEVVPGPFERSLTGIQLQGRYSGNTLTSPSFSASLPFELADWSLFVSFSGPSGRVDFRGPLVLDVYPLAAVPEPSTWAMMILGFGFIGGAIRFRRREARVRYAAA
jgi:hypothetical protein